ncbi:MAG: hypothetical protein MUO80_08090 [Dehalococcoidia bacterium]|nr:hypothetical protein [Dehalococcoidia bacterium]
MSKKNKNKFIEAHADSHKKVVDSLLDAMQDGREYESLLDVAVPNMNFRDELRRGIADIEAIRHHQLIVYAANVINAPAGSSPDISYVDDLPFSEMVSAIPAGTDTLDILIVTPGGSVQQVSQFVNHLRPRFGSVAFIIPYMAMSAGTIWALSGNEIWMDARAFIGPIDPQVPGKDGRFVPAQAILALLKEIQANGQKNIDNGKNPGWSDVMILQNMDAKEIGNALSLSKYSIQLATEYLKVYKLRDWIHGNGTQATDAERAATADKVANLLCSHEHWRTHSHGITRDIAHSELGLKISRPEDVPGLERAIRRFWAVLYFLFDNSDIMKVFVSDQYSIFKKFRLKTPST